MGNQEHPRRGEEIVASNMVCEDGMEGPESKRQVKGTRWDRPPVRGGNSARREGQWEAFLPQR